MAIDIQKLINQLRIRGFLPTVRRWKYTFPTEVILQIVKELGKSITPDFVIDADNGWCYTQLIKWLLGDSTMQAIDPDTGKVVAGRLNAGLYLAGPTGSGKSVALNILLMIARAYNLQVTLKGEKRCICWMEAWADEICEKYALTGDITQYKDAGVLCVQDLGAEQHETCYMGSRTQPARKLIEHRGDAGGVITLFSSNLPMGSSVLVDRYGDRVASRLREMCNYIELKGKDRRKSR